MRDAEKWMDEITPKSLDLGQLRKQIDEDFARDFGDSKVDANFSRDFDNPMLGDDEYAEIAEYKARYGDDWAKYMLLDSSPDYDISLKCINECIYHGEMLHLTGTPDAYFEFRNKLFSRLEHIYGADYRKKLHHPVGDDETVELLLCDALKTGMWKELPDCLHDEYHKRVRERKHE